MILMLIFIEEIIKVELRGLWVGVSATTISGVADCQQLLVHSRLELQCPHAAFAKETECLNGIATRPARQCQPLIKQGTAIRIGQ